MLVLLFSAFRSEIVINFAFVREVLGSLTIPENLEFITLFFFFFFFFYFFFLLSKLLNVDVFLYATIKFLCL